MFRPVHKSGTGERVVVSQLQKEAKCFEEDWHLEATAGASDSSTEVNLK